MKLKKNQYKKEHNKAIQLNPTKLMTYVMKL